MPSEQIRALTDEFQFAGRLVGAERNTTGHINDTFVVRFAEDSGVERRYILQRINHHVFTNPPQVMENIQAVTEHLRQKVVDAGGDPQRETLNIIATRTDTTWHRTAAGDYWRAYDFIEGASTYESVDDPKLFYNAGVAFGRFQQLLSDFPAHALHETIPHFHNTKKRFDQLADAVDQDAGNRAQGAKDDIKFAEQRVEDASVVMDMLAKGQLPLRVIHNDTKLNNVLIDDVTGEAICVLDLDTVMPGSMLFDFGDAIRFGASTAAEDEPDLSKVSVDLDLFRHFTRGYAMTAGQSLTKTERDYLAFSAKLIAYELGMRFLADHLNGDKYFRIARPGHNLDRARSQFKLVADIESKMDALERIVEQEFSAVGHSVAQ